MLADRQVTDLDHGGAVWWVEMEGQLGSPDRLVVGWLVRFGGEGGRGMFSVSGT
jgi:hypothetical protein